MSDQECPDCEGESIEGRGCRTCNSTGKICESGLPPVDPEVLDRAYDAAGRAIFENFEVHPDDLPWEELHATDKVQWLTPELGCGVKAAAPVVAAAAYRQGREDGLREASDLIEDRKIIGAKQRTSIAFNEGLDAARSLLTDKEEGND